MIRAFDQRMRWLLASVFAACLVSSSLCAAEMQTASGENHSLLLAAGGEVYAWGQNGSGQLGNGSNSAASTPVRVLSANTSPLSGGPLTGMIAVAAFGDTSGGPFSLALGSDGTVWAWGDNTYGQLGNGTSGNTKNTASQVQVSGGSALGNIIAISCGRRHAMALRGDGTVWIWGDNTFGQLGNGGTSTTPTLYATQMGSISGVIAIAGGGYHSLALRGDGTVWAWGQDSSGECAQTATASYRTSPVQVLLGAGNPLKGVIAIAGGYQASMALTSTGYVYCWGDNGYGQIGDNTTTARYVATQTSGIFGIRAISCGQWGHKFALSYNGTGYGWGYNGDGRMGYSASTANQLTPVTINTPSGVPIRQMSGGRQVSSFILATGEVYGCGAGVTTPYLVNAQWPVVGMMSVSGGEYHTLGLKSDGTVWAWGYNSYGQLGNGNTTASNVAVQVLTGPGTPLTNVVAVAAGAYHSVALDASGVVWCWGYNFYGQLGNGTTTSSSYAVQAYTAARGIGAGAYASYAVVYQGWLASWGINSNYSLGDGTATNRTSYIYTMTSASTYLSGVKAVDGGYIHALVVLDDGTARGMGYNNFGQLGDGTTTTPSYASSNPGLSLIKGAAAGQYHSLWLRADGSVYAAGYNAGGQLGDGTSAQHTSPEVIGGTPFLGVGAKSISAGSDFGDLSLSLRADGLVYGWGRQDYGQTGTSAAISAGATVTAPGALVNQTSPSIVYSGTMACVTAGDFHGAAVTPGGLVRSWGRNDYGELANGTNTGSVATAVTVPASTTWHPIITLVATTPTASETGPSTGIITVYRTLTTPGLCNITLGAWTGTASPSRVNGTLPTTVVIPAGSTSTTIPITPVDDSIAQGDQTVIANLTNGAGYLVGAPANASVTIQDNDTAGFAVTSPSPSNHTSKGATTGTSVTFTVALTSQPLADVTVPLSSSNTSAGTVSPSSLTFTAVNWNVPQTVTVTGVHDYIVTGNIAYTIITGNAVSGDGTYNGLNPPDVAMINDDTNVAGFAIAPSSGLTVTEPNPTGTSATFTVKLTSQPTAGVTLSLSSSNTAAGLVSPSSLSFNSGNWSTPQTVTVSGVHDFVAGPDIAWTVITAPATSSDPVYNGLNPVDVSVTTTNTDVAGLVISESGGNTAVAESGGSDGYTVALKSKPTANVTLTVSPDSHLTAAPTTLTFTPSNWNTPQSVTIGAIDDQIAEAGAGLTYTATVGHTMASGDASYSGLVGPTVNVTVTDNDSAGLQVSAISGHTSKTGGSATFTVRLTSQPTQTVVVPIASSNTGAGTPSVSSLYFGPAATNGGSGLDASHIALWSTAITVTVTGVQDNPPVITGPVSYSINLGNTTSSDAMYSGNRSATVSVINDDTDVAGVTITQLTNGNTPAGQITESAGAFHSATYSVVLKTKPTQNVTVTPSPGGHVTVSPTSLTFAPGAWNTPQTVTATAIDDNAVESTNLTVPYPDQITHAVASSDANYNALPAATLPVSIIDNDTAGFTVVGPSGHTSDSGATATFTVKLNTLPTANVTIPVTSSNLAEGTVSTASLTFTPGNYGTPQTVTVTGVHDYVATGSPVAYTVVLGAATSSDANYSGLNPPDVSMLNDDIDHVGLDNLSNTLTLSNGNGGTITEQQSGVGAYPTATCAIQLLSQPTATVTVNLVSNDTGHQTVSPASLVFTTANWNTPQTATVSSVDNAEVLSSPLSRQINVTVASADASYAAITTSIPVTITSNYAAGIGLNKASVTTSEDGATDTFTVRLTSKPTANVTVNVSVPNPGAGPSPDLNPSTYTGPPSFSNSSQLYSTSLTFTPAGWNTPQSIILYGQDDGNSPNTGNPTYNVSFGLSSGDSNYNGLSVPKLPGTNIDNDVAAIAISPLSGLTCSENGATASFTVRLNRAPNGAGPVQVTLTSGNTAIGTVSPTTMSFTTSNFNVPQVAVVSAVHDFVATGNQTLTVTSAITANGAGETNYPTSMTGPSPVITCIDTDVRGVTITPVGGAAFVTEGSATSAPYTVVLTSKPTGTVTVAVTPDPDLTVSLDNATFFASRSLTFNAANWNIAQSVYIRALDDHIQENPLRSLAIAHTVSGGGYDGYAAPTLSVTVLDVDTAGFVATAASNGGHVTEAGGQSSFTMRLATQPTSTVTIPVSSTNTGVATVIPANLVYTPANWSTPQTVTAIGVDDKINGGDRTASVQFGPIASGDAFYAALTPASVAIVCDDNDTAGVTITESNNSTDVSLTPGGPGSPDTFTIALASQPTGTVQISLNPDSHLSVSPATVYFAATGLSGSPDGLSAGTAQAWNVPVTVSVNAINDQVARASPYDAAIAFAVSNYSIVGHGASPTVTPVTAAPLTVHVTNTLTPAVIVTETGGSTDVSESGSTDQISLTLATKPTGPVAITATPGTHVTVSAPSGTLANAPCIVYFDVSAGTGDGSGRDSSDPCPWNSSATVTVGAVDDRIAQGGAYTDSLGFSAAGGGYAAVAIPTVTVHIADNDVPGVSVSPTSGLIITETGGSAYFNVQLNTQPVANVTIHVASADTTIGTVATPGTGNLLFTPTNWNQAQQVQIQGVNNFVADGNHIVDFNLTASSGDPGYSGISIPSVTAVNLDKDTIGVHLSTSTISITEAAGATHSATYTVQLTSQPTGPVSLSVLPDASVTISPPVVYFDAAAHGSPDGLTPGTAQAWNVPVTVTVTAVDDSICQGGIGTSHAGIIQHSATGGGYTGLAIPTVTASIADNDTAGIQITQAPAGSSRTVSESLSGFASFLTSVSVTAATKTVQYAAGADLSPYFVGQSVYLATQKTWGAISVIDNSAKTMALLGSFSDTSGETLLFAAGYTVQLTSQPTSLVIVSFASSDTSAGNISPSTLTFTPANWNVPHTITVIGTNDAIDHNGNRTFSIDASAAFSADANFNGLTAASTSFTDIDKDHAGIAVSALSGTVTEGGGSGTFTVQLTSQPQATITIPLTLSAPAAQQVILSAASATFDSSDWNTPQTITVTGQDLDGVDNGPSGVNATIAVGAPVISLGSDPAYAGITTAQANASNLTVNVARSNAPPTIAAIPAVSKLENDPAFPVTVTGLTSGQPGESQNLTVAAISDNSGLIALSAPIVAANPNDGRSATTAQFTITPKVNANGTAHVTVTVTDDASIDGTPQSTSVTFTVTVAAVDQPPVVDIDGVGGANGYAAGSFVEGSPPLPIVDPNNLTVSDVDNATFSFIKATLASAPDGTAELLDVSTVGFPAIAKSYDTTSCTLTLSTSTPQPIGDFQAVLRTLTYQNGSQNPTAGSRSVAIVANDGQLTGSADTSTFTVVPVNNPPVLDLDGNVAGIDSSATWTEGGGPVAIVSPTTLSLTDVDSPTLAKVTASFSVAPPDGAAEVLAASTAGVPGLTATYNPASGILTIAGSSAQPIAGFQTVLRTLTYDNASQNPTTSPRTIDIVADDGSALNNLSATAHAVVAIVAVNNPPTVDLNGPAAGTGFAASYTEGTAPVAIVAAGGLTVTDPDNASLASATAVLTNALDGNAEILAVDTTGTSITASWNVVGATGTLLLSAASPQPIAAFQQVLRTLTYVDQSQNPDTSVARQVQVTANDGSASSLPAIATVTITAVNNPPTVDLNGAAAGVDTTLAFTEGDGAKPFASQGAVTDPDSPMLATMTVTLTPWADGVAESLGADVSGTSISAATSSTTIAGSPALVLTLTGPDSQANFGQVLRSLTYANSSQNPTGGTRTIAVTANDGISAGPAAHCVVTVTPVNNPPTVTVNAGASVQLGNWVGIDRTMLWAHDVDTPGPLTFTISLPPSQGVLKLGSTTLTTGSTFTTTDLDPSDPSHTQNLTYQSTGVATGSDGFAFSVSDGSASSPLQAFAIAITGLNAPIVLNLNEPPRTWTEKTPALQLDLNGDATVTDVDSATNNHCFANGFLSVSYVSGGSPTDRIAIQTVNGGSISVSGNTVSYLGSAFGVITQDGLNGAPLQVSFDSNAAPPMAQALVRTLYFDSTTLNPAGGLRVLRVTVSDGTGSTNPTVDLNVTVIPVDDPPVISPYTIVLTPGLTVSGQFQASDPENDAFVFELDPTALPPTKGTLTVQPNGQFTYQHTNLTGFSDSATIRVRELASAQLITSMTVPIVVTSVDPLAPIVTSAPPMAAAPGIAFSYTPTIQSQPGAQLEYQLVPAPVDGAGTPSAGYTFSGGMAPSHDGTIVWPTLPSPPDGMGYWHFGILVIDHANNRANYQPILLKVVIGAGG